MRDDERYEVVRALDRLPYVAGASFATTWFRLGGLRSPSRQEYREKAAKYFDAACRALDTFPDDERYGPIRAYIRGRLRREVGDILDGRNREVEKRYDRYLDYG